jgi:hypothetical protein
MNYQAFTNDSLTMMYEGIRSALASDDALKGQGEEPRFRVRETPDWKKHAGNLESEMLSRGMFFDVIDWSDDQGHYPGFSADRSAHENTKAKTPPGGSGAFLWGSGDGGSRASQIGPRTLEKVQTRNAWRLLARAISVEGVGQENANTENGKQRCHDFDHRCIPRVATMPKTAVLRKWR